MLFLGKSPHFTPQLLDLSNFDPNYKTGHGGHLNFQNQINLYPETDLGGIELAWLWF